MAYHTIKLKKYLDIVEEYEAAGTITPGMLLMYTSASKVQAHNGQNGNAVPMFALEDELQGKGITDNYVSGDRVQVWIPVRGEQVYALLVDGDVATAGEYLASNGNGFLKSFVGGASIPEDLPLEIVAMALETVDRSSSSGADTNVTGRIRVMIV